MADHIYISSHNPDNSDRAIIILPEIFGLNKFIMTTTDRLAMELGAKAFALDHFFAATGKSQVFGYDDHDEPMKAMQQLSGQQFLELFKATTNEITRQNPTVKQITVVGFCFGGRLAFLAATDKRVTKVASFYGSRSLQDDFYQGKSVIEALVEARNHDSSLSVLGLFGATDPSLPESDRIETKKRLNEAHIAYVEKVYDTGHAFMNFERTDMYSEPASKQAWTDVVEFLKSS